MANLAHVGDSMATSEIIGLGIQIIGLFLGGFAGTRLGALSRIRMERRIEILDNHLPGLRMVHFPSTSEIELVGRYEPSSFDGMGELIAQIEDDDFERLALLGRSVEDPILEIDRLVRALPRVDRAAWITALRSFPVLTAVDYQEAFQRAGSINLTALRFSDSITKALSPFEAHIADQINPSFGSRARLRLRQLNYLQELRKIRNPVRRLRRSGFTDIWSSFDVSDASLSERHDPDRPE